MIVKNRAITVIECRHGLYAMAFGFVNVTSVELRLSPSSRDSAVATPFPECFWSLPLDFVIDCVLRDVDFPDFKVWMDRKHFRSIEEFLTRAGKNGIQAHIMPTFISIVLALGQQVHRVNFERQLRSLTHKTDLTRTVEASKYVASASAFWTLHR